MAWAARCAQNRATILLPGAVLDNVDIVAVVVHHADGSRVRDRKLYRSARLQLCSPGTDEVDVASPGFKVGGRGLFHIV